MGRRVAALALSLAVSSILSAGGAMAAQNDPRLDALFARLLESGDPRAAAPVENEIWQIWLESGDDLLDLRVVRGVGAMNAGDFDAALVEFDSLVEAAPNFAEGFNKRATLLWLMGELDASVRDIARTLELEPRHFGALSGLALIREAQGRAFEALEALEQVMRIHPQMPNLQERIDALSAKLGEAI